MRLASGHNDIELSALGIQQAKDMGARYAQTNFDVIFCSDLQRSFMTAELAFGNKYTIVKDAKLRECDYGDLTQHPKEEIDKEKYNRIETPFPNGESYHDTAKRMKSFLSDITQNYQGKKILIIGHRATQYGLEHWIHNKPLREVVTAPWQWQPGWKYELEKA